MPAKDRYHDVVKAALIADGWTITDENYVIRIGKQRIFIDLEAEHQLIAAAIGDHKIAVEVKSFVGASTVVDLREAVGQYVLYRSVLRRVDPERVPYLAIDMVTAQEVFSEPLADYLVTDEQVRILVVDIVTERILEWRR
jgi:hypothetical protein